MSRSSVWLAALATGCVSFPHEMPEGITEETATPQASDTASPPEETATPSHAEPLDVVHMAYLHRTRVGAGAPPDTPEEHMPAARPEAHLLRLAFGTDPLPVPLSSPCVVDNTYCWNQLPEPGAWMPAAELDVTRPLHVAADAGTDILVNAEPAERVRRLSGERFFYTRPFPEPPTDNLRMHASLPGGNLISGIITSDLAIPEPATMRLADDRGRRELTPAANKVIFDWTPASESEVVLIEVDSRKGPFHRIYRADNSGVFEFDLSDVSASYGNRHFDVRVYRFEPQVHRVGDAEVHLTYISEDSFQVADHFECPVDITLYSGTWGGEISVTMTSPEGEVVYEDPGWVGSTYTTITDTLEGAMLVPGTYDLEFGESYGDGWNGGYFKIEQDGSEVYYFSITSWSVYSETDTYEHTCD